MSNFKSFPLSSDLLSVADQHFAGIAGAHRILLQISAEIHKLDASRNDIGVRGALALFDGLNSTRRRFSVLPATPRGRTPSPNRYRMALNEANGQPAVPPGVVVNRNKGDLWGMCEINLSNNAIEDDGLLAAVHYVQRDQWMRDLLLQGNAITLTDIVDDVVRSLNESHLAKMSLSSNPLDRAAVIRFFETINAPKLRALHMSVCGLPAACVPAICDFLKSPRSQHMWLLEFNANSLSRAGVTAILDAMEVGNFTISRIGLDANNSAPARFAEEDQGAGYFPPGPGDDDDVWESDETMRPENPKSMNYQMKERLPALQKRNGKLNKRVRTAAARAIAPLRIILHARAPTPEPEGDGDGDVEMAASNTDVEMADAAASTSFPFMDLPVEVQLVIARHASGDADALSDAQWARLLSHASDRSAIRKLRERTASAEARVATTHVIGAQEKYKMREVRKVRDEWLGELQCEWWELANRWYWDRL